MMILELPSAHPPLRLAAATILDFDYEARGDHPTTIDHTYLLAHHLRVDQYHFSQARSVATIGSPNVRSLPSE